PLEALGLDHRAVARPHVAAERLAIGEEDGPTSRIDPLFAQRVAEVAPAQAHDDLRPRQTSGEDLRRAPDRVALLRVLAHEDAMARLVGDDAIADARDARAVTSLTRFGFHGCASH